MLDDKDFEDLLISFYKCELCGETFKDKIFIYFYVLIFCFYFGVRRKESKLFFDDKFVVKILLNFVNFNRGKLFSVIIN